MPEQLFWRGRRLNYVRKAGRSRMREIGCQMMMGITTLSLLFKRATTDTVPLSFFLASERRLLLFLVYSLPKKSYIHRSTRCVISFRSNTLPLNQEFFSPCCCFSLFPVFFSLYTYIFIYIHGGLGAWIAGAKDRAGRNTLFPAWGPREEWR